MPPRVFLEAIMAALLMAFFYGYVMVCYEVFFSPRLALDKQPPHHGRSGAVRSNQRSNEFKVSFTAPEDDAT